MGVVPKGLASEFGSSLFEHTMLRMQAFTPFNRFFRALDTLVPQSCAWTLNPMNHPDNLSSTSVALRREGAAPLVAPKIVDRDNTRLCRGYL